ncbi:Uncharacterised protein [Mycobacterium tuberculosis]|uniref:Uncharacterized protein n=1 Tax=Mycobacterium tuberculosis TaxID=1773 RepID=A0A916PGZ9_MYCTX|nr:Uncharacterised protein [Mycobacterium tuberculosis]COV21138.1 Uncharacterised protein [Mycobacterium tuberculosis]COX10259.1 Uncharacterised protein [Mycobacterium tuberculosis]COZ24126.1 Uncharacterised protein [Mycobacterium tuberculosis]COZ47294.1 Uncharacterised protein [Mycobacterium tuberculosis]
MLAAIAMRTSRLVANVERLKMLWSASKAMNPRIAPRSMPTMIKTRTAVITER